MELSDTQKATIAGWVHENKSVAEIQNLLRDELGLSMTYMDVRFLIEDLELTFEEPPQEEEDDKTEDGEAELMPAETSAKPLPKLFDDEGAEDAVPVLTAPPSSNLFGDAV